MRLSLVIYDEIPLAEVPSNVARMWHSASIVACENKNANWR